MFRALLRTLPLLGLFCLASFVRAEEKATPIHDGARMFHAAAIDDAEQKIADIQRTFDCGVFVRTIDSVSPQPSRWFPVLRTPRINRLLEEQTQTFAEESEVPGIYIVICKRPRDVHLIIRPEGNASLNRHDAETLRQSLLRDLHEKSADRALRVLVDRVQNTLQDHAEHRSSPVVQGVVLVGLLGGGSALWLVLRLIRRRIDAGSVRDLGELPRERSILLGTMFGFPAGLWIYDKLCPYSENISG